MAETLFRVSSTLIPAAWGAAGLLAVAYLVFVFWTKEASQRDDGLYWASLGEKGQDRIAKRLHYVSSALNAVLLLAIIYGVWCTWYGIRH